MVQKLACFLCMIVMGYCFEKLLPDNLYRGNMLIKWGILFVIVLVLFGLFFYMMDGKLRIILSLIYAVIIILIEILLTKSIRL